MSFSGLFKCHEILVSWMFCLNLYLEGKLPVILNVLSKPDVISVEVYVVVTLSRKGHGKVVNFHCYQFYQGYQGYQFPLLSNDKVDGHALWGAKCWIGTA